MNLFQVKAFQAREQLRTVLRYYRFFRFALLDLTVGLSALFFNPYRICRKFLQKKGASEIYAYGETPFSTFEKLAAAAELGPEDRFVELGSGRGKLCFWAALIAGCNVRGIEQVPFFVRFSTTLSRLFRVQAHFEEGQIEGADLSDATVVYLYAMEWREESLLRMKRGARLIAIGEPAGEGFETICTLPAVFPWGTAEAFIQRKKVGYSQVSDIQ